MTIHVYKEPTVHIRVGFGRSPMILPVHDVRLMIDALEALRMHSLPTSYRSIDLLRDALREATR